MRVLETPNNETAQADTYWETLASSLPTQQVYHEMSETPVTETDVLSQLRANIETLAGLQGRMSFIMREVKYLMKA